MAPEPGWRFSRINPSLPEVYRSIKIPSVGRNWWGIVRKLLAFSGPGYLVAVGYMDPGNWATRPCGRLAVLLHAVIGGDHLQPHGHFPATLGPKAGRGDRPRSGSSLPRSFPSDRQFLFLDRLRNSYRCVRSGRSDRFRHCLEFALRTTSDLGRLFNSVRRNRSSFICKIKGSA